MQSYYANARQMKRAAPQVRQLMTYLVRESRGAQMPKASHKRYEFGAKASFVTIAQGNWLVFAQSLTNNPYDGHTLAAARYDKT